MTTYHFFFPEKHIKHRSYVTDLNTMQDIMTEKFSNVVNHNMIIDMSKKMQNRKSGSFPYTPFICIAAALLFLYLM